MARIEPSLYEPADDVRIFDGAEELADEGSRLPLLIVVALLVFASFAGVVWLAYSQGVARGAASSPRILTAASGPTKVAPVNTGGASSPYHELKIYQQPAPRNDGSEGAASTTAPEDAVDTKKRTIVAKQSPNNPSVTNSAVIPSTQTRTAAKPALRSGASDSRSATSGPAAGGSKQAEAEATELSSKKSQAALGPKSQPSILATPAEVLQPGTGLPTERVASKTPAGLHVDNRGAAKGEGVKSISDTSKAASTSEGGSYFLQVGSFKSEIEANESWERFKTKHSAMVGHYGPNIQPVDLGAKGIWYRLRLGAFPDKDAAADVCVKLRAAGGSCLIGR